MLSYVLLLLVAVSLSQASVGHPDQCCNDMKRLIQGMNVEMDRMRREMSGLTDKVNSLSTSLPKVILEVIELKAKDVQISKVMGEMQAEMNGIKRDNERMKAEINVFRSDNERLKEDVGSLKRENSVLKTQMGELEKGLTGVKSEVVVVRNEIGGLKREIAGLKAENAGFSQQIGELKTEVRGLRAQFGGLKTEVDSLRGEMNGVKADLSRVTADVRVLTSDVSGLKTSVNTLRADVNVVQSDVTTLKVDMRSVRITISNLNSDVSTLKIEVNNLKTEVNNLKNQIQPSSCPVGYTYLPGLRSCYKLNTQIQTWEQARTSCAASGASLAAVTTATETRYVNEYLLSTGASLTTTCSDGIWIGGQRQNPDSCSTPFVWRRYGGGIASFMYTYWHSGQPDCLGNQETCVSIFRLDNALRWNDNRCANWFCSLCQK